MLYKPLPPALVRKMIEGVPDELTELADRRMRSIKSKPCPRCQSAMHPFLNPKHAFSPDDPLPRTLARCTECGLEWDPLTNLIISPGSAANVEDPYPVIRGRDD
jgi:hypothetical protein